MGGVFPSEPETNMPANPAKESELTAFSQQETAQPAAPAKLSARDKAAATDEAAWAIIDAEALARENKTEKLRALRIEREQSEASSAKPPAPRRRIRAS